MTKQLHYSLFFRKKKTSTISFFAIILVFFLVNELFYLEILEILFSPCPPLY